MTKVTVIYSQYILSIILHVFQGHPRLVNVLADLYSPLTGHKIDPFHEVTVSVGAYGVLFCTVQGLINPGDEVILCSGIVKFPKFMKIHL